MSFSTKSSISQLDGMYFKFYNMYPGIYTVFAQQWLALHSTDGYLIGDRRGPPDDEKRAQVNQERQQAR